MSPTRLVKFSHFLTEATESSIMLPTVAAVLPAEKLNETLVK
jgi:hypothetical protein